MINTKEDIYYLSKVFNLEPFTLQILSTRGIQTEEAISQFLFPHPSFLYDPYLFLDMHRAVFRILRAIENEEKIVIFGDYDVDVRQSRRVKESV